MPTILSEDAKSAVVQRDDGSQFTMAKTPETERILANIRPTPGSDKPLMERIFGDGSSRLADKAQPEEARTPAEAPAGNIFQKNSEIVQSGDYAPAEPSQAPTPVSAPAEGAASSAPQPSQGGVAETGLDMIGQGFASSKDAIKKQQDAIMEGAEAGHKAAMAQVAAIDTFEKAQKEKDRIALEDSALRDQKLQEKMSEVNKAKEAYLQQGAVDPNRLWNNKSGWQKALAGLSVLLGSISTDPHHVNQGLKAINDAIEMDVKTQQNRQEQLKVGYEMERQGFQDLRQQFHDRTEQYLFQKQVRLDALNLYVQKVAAQAQGTELAAKAKALSAQLQDASGQLQRQQGELYLSTIPSVKDVKPEQWKAAQFASRLEQAESDFASLSKTGYSRADLTSAAGAKLPEGLKSENLKRQEQAEANFLTAVLRKESGAAISPSELTTAAKQYFPRAGDTPEVLRQKARNRMQAMAGLRAEAGHAMRLMPVITAAPVPTGFTPVSHRR